MQAYDELVAVTKAQGNPEKVQSVLEQAVAISPMALLRQQKLAQTATENNDASVAANAWRRTVRLGENSCYDELDNHLNFVRASASLFKEDENQARDVARDALRVVETLGNRFELSAEEKVQGKLLECQVQFGMGNESRGRELLTAAEALVEEGDMLVGLDAELDLVQAKFSAKEDAQAAILLNELAVKYKDDDEALQKIDRLLEEPVSETNRQRVAKINKEGIGLYNDDKFKESINCFKQARRIFPNHVGVHLNLVQALVAEMREYGTQEEQIGMALDVIRKIEKQITANHEQFQRFRQLYEMVRKLG